MKSTTAVAIINTAMWITTSAAIIFAVYATQRISPLWFFLIPAISGFTANTTSKRNDLKDGD